MAEFEILVYPGGRTSIHVKGVKGKGCEDLVKGIVAALANDPADVEREYTAEYHEAPAKAKQEAKAR